MQTKITIRNEAQRCYIDIEGTIGVSEECQWESADNRVATFERLRQEVKRIAEVNADEVVVNIRSTGGDVNDALLIYDALRGLDAHITTRCYGYTASAATIIAQAADEGARELSANSLYLIHSATCAIDGNSHSLASRAELLRKTDERLAELYALHSGGDASYYASLMAENQGEGRWLTAEEAIEAGLADAIIDDEAEGDIAAEPETKEATEAEEAEEAMPQNVAKKTKKGGRTIAGGIIHFLLKRLAYRIEEWLDNLREKRAAKRKEKELAEKEQNEEPQESQQGASAEPATEPKRRRSRRKRVEKISPEEPDDQTATLEEASPEKRASGEGAEPADNDSPNGNNPMPQAQAIPSTASVITLRQRQSRYKRTAVKDCEDPAMASVTALANDKAYEEDARQMSQR